MDFAITWSILIGVALFIYMALDGFDLGIGILFPLGSSSDERDQMMYSIAPIWDTNETWLVLAAGGLYGVFPKAYVFIFNALYIPLTAMLICLIFRGVSFEFRIKSAERFKFIWSFMFFVGSLGASLCQGIILGQLIRGFHANTHNFNYNYWGWFEDFNFFVGVLVVLFYAFMGANFLIYRFQGMQKQRFVTIAKRLLFILVIFFIALVFISSYIMHTHPNTEIFPAGHHLEERFHSFYSSYIVLLGVISLIVFKLYRTLSDESMIDYYPFIYGIILLVLVFAGITFLGWPYIVPGVYTIWEASSQHETQKLMFIGAAAFLPLILGYSAYNFYVFRGKISEQKFYH